MTTPGLTARRVAERRAAHQLLDAPIVFDDPLALKIVGVTRPDERARLIAREQGRLSRTLRAFMAARSRVAEDDLAKRVRQGLTQYVVLGAGLDTFACRNPFGASLRVFEVDQPSTQAWKRERLAESGIGEPDTLALVAVDFETDDVFERLAAEGWDASAPSLFAWLGVTMYLETDTVHQLLCRIAQQPRGSGVVFDYAITPTLLGPVERFVFDEFARRVAAAGEPWISTFNPDELHGQLRAFGFTSVEDLGSDELNARYFGDRADGMRVGTLAQIVLATV
jgi:methyltransferase (TIGR00027 family)